MRLLKALVLGSVIANHPSPEVPPLPPLPPDQTITNLAGLNQIATNLQNKVSAVARDVVADPSGDPGNAAVAIPMVVTAYWPEFTNAVGTELGFFQASTDLVNWTTIYTFPYPTNGAWVTITNISVPSPAVFFRAGAEQ